MKKPDIVVITAIISLTILELTAIIRGLDGYLFSLIVVAIAGIAGYKMPDVIKRIRKK